jgi:hypothetical protein
MLVTAAVTAFVPWLTALFAARRAPQAVKAGVTALLSAATGILVELQSDPGYEWKSAVLFAAEGFAVATLSHLNLWKPLGLTGSTGLIQTKVPKGVG